MAGDSAPEHFLLRLLPPRLRERFAPGQELHRALINVNWLALQTVFEAALGLVVGIWMARYLAPERFGTLSYAIAFVQMFAPLATLGLGSVVVRDIVAKPDAVPALMGTTALLRGLGSLALLIATMVTIRFVRPDDADVWLFVLIVAISHGVRNLGVVELWFQAHLHGKYVMLSRGASRLLGAAMKVALIVSGSGLTLFVVAYGVDVGLPALGMLVFYAFVTKQRVRGWRVDGSMARQLFSDSWPLVFSGVMSVVYMKIDQVMLGQMHGDGEVGIYAAAVRISEAFYLLPNIVLISVFPWLIKGKSQGHDVYMGRFQRLYDLFVWGAIGAGLITQLAAGPLMTQLFGESYAAAGAVLAVHIWGGLFWFSGSIGHRYLIAENYTRLTLYMTTSGAVVNVLLNLWLIPPLGAMGAAYATLASFAVSHWLAGALAPESRPMLWFFLRAFDPLGLVRRWRSLRS